MSTGTTLGFFKNLILHGGLENLKTDFHNLANANLRDSRKDYDEEEEAYYLFRKNHETYEISEESYPRKFNKELQHRLERELKRSLERIDQQLESRKESESIQKYLVFITDELNKLITHLESSEELSKYDSIKEALLILQNRIEKLEEIYIDENSSNRNDNMIKEFSEVFAENADYSAELISRYLKHWIDFKGFHYRRAKAKGMLEQEKLSIPNDGTLRNWEQKWEEYTAARTEN